MPEPIIVADISPERLEKWKRRCPLHWRAILQSFDNDAVIRRGGADLEFRRKALDRVLRLFIALYDVACAEKHRPGMRRSFRFLLREYPIIGLLNPSFQQRLSEHDGWVRLGMDDPDPDEIEGGCDA